ncbi:hypothetical protein LTR10_024010 [Elasticomyces elasticus]|uniref:Zn(2)-C6 fungal-type domain-containing protein n=1 Tax=Exophiala sideris TaxID=1016849 RepID=A0ABR0J676_9EURO|nr:hypothetical protein LTR10_024010 [Elasticomyces elasticus]KAK5028803.1 hypothetical protein LTS07_006182 [Exophiala sideris]KAK5035672.1 hypothetical protein LTR13_005801 [Exophiala sideris]KAK5057307.1 hypothetical protein LTR69_007346 [Exophiala sideris]KAK5181720.1 hypothetical protein LTR44_005920 [Eurotiomycetes sp. CCFEE 6388]
MTSSRITRPRKSRSRGLRVKTGCLTCRKRHLKCDEVKPSCWLCAKSGKACVYEDVIAEEPDATTGRDPTASAQGFQVASNEGQPSTETPLSTSLNPSSPSVSQVGDDSNEPVQNTWITSEQNISNELSLPMGGNGGQSGMQAHFVTQARHDSPRLRPLETEVSVGVSLQPQTFHPPAELFGPSPDAPTELSYGSLVDVATARWFGMLANDAEIDTNNFDVTAAQNQFAATASVTDSANSWPTPPARSTTNGSNHGFAWASQTPGRDEADCTMWKSPRPLTLRGHERRLFGLFVNPISQWMDLFDPFRHFCTLVPRLAMYNVGLLNAILTLSIRFVSLNPSLEMGDNLERGNALRYYHESLHYVQNAMQYTSYLTSLELLATTLIISTYEMLDGSGRDWERHLQGVFGIQRSQVIHGDTGGLRAAVWWAWLQQDVWAAFRDKRRVFTFWRPVKTFSDLNPWEIAARSVFLFARVVDYCSEIENAGENNNIQSRMDGADRLSLLLDDWERHLTIEFTPLPMEESSSERIFKPCWIQPASFGAAMQVYNAARILLALHRPSPGGFAGFMKRRKQLDNFVDTICGIAITLTDYGSSVTSSQCLFIAGMCTTEEHKRNEILRLIGLCRQRTGWPLRAMNEDLKGVWDNSEAG